LKRRRWGIANATFAILWAAVLAPHGAGVEMAPPEARPGAQASGVVETAQKQFHAGNYAEAIRTLQPAAAQNSSNSEIYYWLGRSYYEIRDYDNAVLQFGRAATLDARNSDDHMWLGRAYGGKADRERSFFLARRVKKEFEQAVSLNPANIPARRDLEEYCLEAPWIVGGSKDEALDQVNAIAAMDPVEGNLARGFYYWHGLKKPDVAEGEYRNALAAKPGRVEPYFEAGDFFRHRGNVAELEAAIEGAARVSANDARLPFYRGVAGVLANTNLERAEQELKSYLASTPDRSDWPSHAAAREWLGRLYEAQGKRAEAAEQYRAALQLDPQRREARARLERLVGKTSP